MVEVMEVVEVVVVMVEVVDLDTMDKWTTSSHACLSRFKIR